VFKFLDAPAFSFNLPLYYSTIFPYGICSFNASLWDSPLYIDSFLYSFLPERLHVPLFLNGGIRFCNFFHYEFIIVKLIFREEPNCYFKFSFACWIGLYGSKSQYVLFGITMIGLHLNTFKIYSSIFHICTITCCFSYFSSSACDCWGCQGNYVLSS
jgi:hypothetical protein